MAAPVVDREATLEVLRDDFLTYAEHCLWIVDKEGGLVRFKLNAAQRALVRLLFAQRTAGRAMRAIVLKARQVGISTLVQALLMWRATLNANHKAIVVAHNLDTGGNLYEMGKTMYTYLPDTPELKPQIGSYKRTRQMNFSNKGEGWQHGDPGLGSEYLVSTAEESESGRGRTYRSAHFSEAAMYPQIEDKLTAILNGLAKDPDSLAVIESTARGPNAFKDRWDAAEAGKSGWIPFFWPWWKHEEYTMPFLNDAERARFRPGDTNQSPYAEDELLLLDPGPVDTLTGEHVPLTLEQLNWRRRAIADDCGGDMNKWCEEYPTVPEDAFIASGANVFEGLHVRRILREIGDREPKYLGAVKAKEHVTRAGKFGRVEVPNGPLWTPAERLLPGDNLNPDWKLWLDLEEDPKTKLLRPPEDGCYVCGVDVSGGINESGEGGDAAFHAIEVVDHETGKQVAEYSSRCDPDLLAEFVYLTALFFNDAWLAIELTGNWGLPIARTIVQDWRYRFPYMRKTHERREDRQQDRFGWETRPNTKPVLLALGQELIRGDGHGINSPDLLREMQTYVRTATGKTLPERGKFADRLIAWLIAKQVALELPVRKRKPKRKGRIWRPSNPITGY